MISQVSDIPMVIQYAAKHYVDGYLQDNQVRGNHSAFMQTCYQCENGYIRQMADYIDVLLADKTLED